jgi:hypothetical protein
MTYPNGNGASPTGLVDEMTRAAAAEVAPVAALANAVAARVENAARTAERALDATHALGRRVDRSQRHNEASFARLEHQTAELEVGLLEAFGRIASGDARLEGQIASARAKASEANTRAVDAAERAETTGRHDRQQSDAEIIEHLVRRGAGLPPKLSPEDARAARARKAKRHAAYLKVGIALGLAAATALGAAVSQLLSN